MNAIKLALLAVGVLLVGQISGWRLLDWLFYALTGLLLLALALSLFSLRGLRLTRETPSERGQVGQLFTERLRLENVSRLGKLWVEVDDLSTLPGHHAGAVVTLAGHGQRPWTVSTRLTERGRFRLGPVVLRGGDPFGLFPRQQARRGTGDLLVYPATVPLVSVGLLAGELPGGTITHRRTPHVTPNVAGIREYAPSDGFNRIAWAPSARLGRLMVKEFELDPTADVWLVLDMDQAVHQAPVPLETVSAPHQEHSAPHWRPPTADWRLAERWRASTEEFSVVVTASLALHFLDQKRAVGLLTAGQHHEVIPTDRGPRQIVKLLEALAVIRAAGEQSLGELLTAEAGRFRRHSSVIIVTPATDEGWAPALTTLTRGGVRISVVLVEAGTFGPPVGGAAPPLLLVSQLASRHIPTFLLKQADDLAMALRVPNTEYRGPSPGRHAPRTAP